jgi:Tfp pilus assembly protein PilF
MGILVLGCGIDGVAQDIERIVAQNELAVVVITGMRSSTGGEVQSSGCVVDSSGLILTTAHQIVGVGQLEGRLADGTTFPLKVITAQLDNELALLKADRDLPRVVRLGNAETLRSGAPLVSIATPVSLDFTTVTGIVSSTNRTYRGYPVIQSDLRASPGSSGGPIFDRNGDLVGLIIGKLGDEEWVTVINSVNNAFDLLRQYGVTVGGGNESSDMALLPADGISEVELSAVMAFNRGVHATRVEEKASEYARAATLLPAFYEAHFNFAVACTEMKDYRKAEAAYRKAERLRPKSTETKRNLGRIFLREMRYEEAAALFEGVVQLAPQEAQSHNDAAEAYRQLNRVGEAILSYEQALALDPSYAAAHFHLGLPLANAGDSVTSIEHFNEYLKHAPDARDVAQVRGWIAELQKQ